LHMAQRIPLPLTVSCFSKIEIGFTFLVPAHLGSPGQRAVKRVCVCSRIQKISSVQWRLKCQVIRLCNFRCAHLCYTFHTFTPTIQSVKDHWTELLFLLMAVLASTFETHKQSNMHGSAGACMKVSNNSRVCYSRNPAVRRATPSCSLSTPDAS